MDLPIFDLSTADGRAGFAARLERLRGLASPSSDAGQAVAAIVDDVRRRGDDAVVEYMQRWTDPAFTADRIRVSPEELDRAERGLDPPLRRHLEAAISHVRVYQRHIRPAEPPPLEIGGARLGLRFTPVDSVGLTVPGGKAVLFSSVIMLAVPAQEAGVDPRRISVVNPPPDRRGGATAGDISPLMLATCRLLGIERVYRIGGAQAVAALAFGTASVEKVDLVAGPGNVFVQLAKAQLAGRVGSDNGFYGPSEIVTLADATADPRRVASDLLAQAEHDPGKCFLIAWSRGVLAEIAAEVRAQAAGSGRRAAIEAALSAESALVLTRDEAHAAAVADEIAAEHVSLAVADPEAWLSRLRHGGEFFLGDAAPVAAGDYYAGPSHCLPTGTTARFASGVSVYTFLKRSGTVAYPKGMPADAVEAVAALAEAEGLDAHAASARRRRSDEPRP